MGFIDQGFFLKKELEILFVVMTVALVYFRCWGMLSKQVRIDFPTIQKPHLVTIADYVELFLAGGIASMLLAEPFNLPLFPIWGTLFILSYSLYLTFFAFYIIHRKKILSDSK